VISDALDVDDEEIWLFVENPAAEKRDHPLAGGR
jgi:hypothetical protein